MIEIDISSYKVQIIKKRKSKNDKNLQDFSQLLVIILNNKIHKTIFISYFFIVIKKIIYHTVQNNR